MLVQNATGKLVAPECDRECLPIPFLQKLKISVDDLTIP